jgi:hypothetical protein
MKRMILSTVSLVVVAALALIITSASAIAQETPAAPTANATLPSPLSTAQPPSSITPQDLQSLSGVGGTPLHSNVRIRVEPGLDARQMGILRYGRFIDIVGTNGFDTTRSCDVNFESTLDMWVQVVYREQRGWIARCTLRVYGDMSRLPIEATPEAVG